jgi:Protein of unknown function (DUF1573)
LTQDKNSEGFAENTTVFNVVESDKTMRHRLTKTAAYLLLGLLTVSTPIRPSRAEETNVKNSKKKGEAVASIQPTANAKLAQASQDAGKEFASLSVVEKLDLGRIKVGSTKKHITITNTGNVELNIDRIRSTCACIKPGVRKTTIAPGESYELPLEVQRHSRRKRKLKFVLYLTSNDNENKITRVALKVNFI